jgi:dolichol-phosphate mannosyltransferase
MPELSILVPCRDQGQTLPSLAARLQGVCVESDIELETIILDDASEDGTLKMGMALQQQYPALNVRVIHRARPRKGYGALLRFGLAHAAARYCLVVSPDETHPIELLPRYLAAARRGAHLVYCSGCTHSSNGNHIPATLKHHGAYRALSRLLIASDLPDPACSFMLIDRIYLMAIGVHSNGLAVMPEMCFKIRLSGGAVVPITADNGPTISPIVPSTWRGEGLGFLYVLLRAWWHRLGVPWF